MKAPEVNKLSKKSRSHFTKAPEVNKLSKKSRSNFKKAPEVNKFSKHLGATSRRLHGQINFPKI
jgi:hypothetical protein